MSDSVQELRHADMLSDLARKITGWLNRRQRWRDLNSLDDRLLEDVGISREEANWNARKPFWSA